jgi:hypothetical protein
MEDNKVQSEECILSHLTFAMAKDTVAEQARDAREHDTWIKTLDAVYARMEPDGASIYDSIDSKALERYVQWRNLKPLMANTAKGLEPLA